MLGEFHIPPPPGFCYKEFNKETHGASLGGSVVKNPPANAGDTGSIPGPGGSPVPWSNQARVPQLLIPHATATEAHTPSSPHSRTREATALRCLSSKSREEPWVSATKESP